jgi:hypothetical protein
MKKLRDVVQENLGPDETVPGAFNTMCSKPGTLAEKQLS